MPISTSPNFTVRVKDLGRLAEAEVELRPMTLFVGENNSGKSYLATLLWALHDPPYSMWSECGSPAWTKAVVEWEAAIDRLTELAKTRPLKEYNVWSGDETRRGLPVVGPDEVAIELDVQWLALANEMRQDALRWLVKRIFGYAGLQPSIEFEFSTSFRPVLAFSGSSASGRTGLVFDAGPDRQPIYVKLFAAEDDTTNRVAMSMVGRILSYFSGFIGGSGGSYLSGSPYIFLPASRSGIVWAGDILSERREAEKDKRLPGLPSTVQSFLKLVKPYGQFFENSAYFSDAIRTGRYGTMAERMDLLEKERMIELLKKHCSIGHISLSSEGSLWQRPDGADVQLPMSLASSVVTELIPIFLLLSNNQKALPKLLVYEEPEAHLHPRLQRVVAVILARLSRLGTKVLVTTHSETFAQQINNLIKRGGLDPETRAAMVGDSPCEADDWLSPDDVAGYEFRFRDDGRSYTEPLEVRTDGIVMPMFNKELLALTEEAIRLDEALATKRVGG